MSKMVHLCLQRFRERHQTWRNPTQTFDPASDGIQRALRNSGIYGWKLVKFCMDYMPLPSIKNRDSMAP